METYSWKKGLEECFEHTGDTLDDLACTLSEDDLILEFDESLGIIQGKPFGAWSKDFVYFPACYDGAEKVAFVPRNPTGRPIEHIGDNC